MITQETAILTRGGELLDQICKRAYGSERGTTEMVLAANSGLADLLPVLPEGVLVILPPAPAPSKRTRASIHLWD
jgi:phage tail protein X